MSCLRCRSLLSASVVGLRQRSLLCSADPHWHGVSRRSAVPIIAVAMSVNTLWYQSSSSRHRLMLYDTGRHRSRSVSCRFAALVIAFIAAPVVALRRPSLLTSWRRSLFGSTDRRHRGAALVIVIVVVAAVIAMHHRSSMSFWRRSSASIIAVPVPIVASSSSSLRLRHRSLFYSANHHCIIFFPFNVDGV